MTLADFQLPEALRRPLENLIPVICPADAESLGLCASLVDHVELTMRSMPTYLRTGVLAGLVTFEQGARAYPSSLGRPFSRLPRPLAEAYFSRWWHSPLPPLRQLAKALKGFLALAYWEHPVILERMAYHPDRWIAEVAKRRLDSYGAHIRATEKALLERDPLRGGRAHPASATPANGRPPAAPNGSARDAAAVAKSAS